MINTIKRMIDDWDRFLWRDFYDPAFGDSSSCSYCGVVHSQAAKASVFNGYCVDLWGIEGYFKTREAIAREIIRYDNEDAVGSLIDIIIWSTKKDTPQHHSLFETQILGINRETDVIVDEDVFTISTNLCEIGWRDILANLERAKEFSAYMEHIGLDCCVDDTRDVLVRKLDLLEIEASTCSSNSKKSNKGRL